MFYSGKYNLLAKAGRPINQTSLILSVGLLLNFVFITERHEQ